MRNTDTSKAVIAWKQTKVERIKAYGSSPKMCKQCSGVIPYEKRQNTFCSYRCAANFNNKARKLPSNAKLKNGKPARGICETCGEFTPSSNTKKCWECYNKERVEAATLGQHLERSKVNKARHKYQAIRVQAVRLCFGKYGKKKVCAVCGYDKHVEVCHVKPICDFNPDTKLIDVNASSNLIVLCPNHHWELDNGILNVSVA